MDAVQFAEQMKQWEKQVETHCLSQPGALAALYNLLTNVATQVSERDAEIQRLDAQVSDLTAARDSCREDKRAAETRADKTYVALQEEKTKTETLRKEAAYLIAELEKLKANRAAIIERSREERVPSRENEAPPDAY